MTIHNAFHQGQYQKVIDFDTSLLSADNALPGRVLQLRAQIASGQAEEVLADIEGEDEVPDLAAVKALAQYSIGSTTEAVKEAEYLATASSENMVVQILGGTILQAAGKGEEALALLTKHSGSLEACVTLSRVFSKTRDALTCLSVQVWLSLCRYTFKRTGQTLPRKRLRQLANGRKTACLSTSRSHGLA